MLLFFFLYIFICQKKQTCTLSKKKKKKLSGSDQSDKKDNKELRSGEATSPTALAENDNPNQLRFQPLSSVVSPQFWTAFARLKKDILKLSEEPIDIIGTFTSGYYHKQAKLPPRIFIDEKSLGSNGSGQSDIPRFYFTCPGRLINCNTYEAFKNMDKKKLLLEESAKILKDIQTQKVLEDPSLLQRFLMLSFADLKKHTYAYWLCFPAIVPDNLEMQKHRVHAFADYFTVKE
ncbi:hypothetical protein RFI_08039, partial [Reticulomyxa filosa]